MRFIHLQISAQELASAMGFLREQMGEEELRHLLEMLSVEAGARRLAGCRGAGRWCRGPGGAGRSGAGQRGRAVEAVDRQARNAAPTPTGWQRAAWLQPVHCHPSAGHPRTFLSCVPTRIAGKDGGIDVNRLMELADEAEEEEAGEDNGAHHHHHST